jgi:hypothetical protein
VIYEYLYALSENIDHDNVNIGSSDSHDNDTRVTDSGNPDIRNTDINDDMNTNDDNDDIDNSDSENYDRYNINRKKRSGNALALAGRKRLPMTFHMICNGYRKHGKILEMVKFIEKYGIVEN